MRTLEELKIRLMQGKFEFSHHAFKRAVERNISETEIRQVGQNAILIEDYPNDKYGPSCLLLGFAESARALHLQVSRMNTELVKIVTLYQPNEAEWVNNYSKRR